MQINGPITFQKDDNFIAQGNMVDAKTGLGLLTFFSSGSGSGS